MTHYNEFIAYIVLRSHNVFESLSHRSLDKDFTNKKIGINHHLTKTYYPSDSDTLYKNLCTIVVYRTWISTYTQYERNGKPYMGRH